MERGQKRTGRSGRSADDKTQGKSGRPGLAHGAGAPCASPLPPTGFWPGQQGYAIIPWWNPLHWNWRRGLVRLWLLASLLWAGYWLYNLQLACAFWFAPWCEAPAHVDWPNGSMLLGLAMVLLSGPLLMLAAWWVIRWAIRGLLARRAR